LIKRRSRTSLRNGPYDHLSVTATPGSAIVHHCSNFVFGPVPELPPPVDYHSDHLERFAGDYGSSIIVRVAAERTGLLVQPRDQPAFSVISAIPPKYAATAAQRNAKQHQAPRMQWRVTTAGAWRCNSRTRPTSELASTSFGTGLATPSEEVAPLSWTRNRQPLCDDLAIYAALAVG
jgi:hypothetical protein